MDPTANILEQQRLAEELLALVDEDVPWATEEHGYSSDNWGDEQDRSEYFENRADRLEGKVARLAELVISLHEWRQKGGFDPYTTSEPDICDECGAITPPEAKTVQGRWHDSACSLRDDTVEA